jgi:hypothetical protein
MPSIIHFVGRDQLMVREDQAAVQAAFCQSDGRPMVLTHQRSGNAVFINPGQVTYWQGRGAREQTHHRAGVGRVPSLR